MKFAEEASGGSLSAQLARAAREARADEVLERIERRRTLRPQFSDARITMAHGAGGKATRALVEGLLVPSFTSQILDQLDDAAVLHLDGVGLAVTTDAFVVKPLRFPGGSIGSLAVNGTANDLAVAGALPLVLAVALVLEEGLAAADLTAEVAAIAAAARGAGMEIVAGDTKVVERGHGDGLYITTTGIGLLDARARLSPKGLRPGDRVLVSGSIAEHGTAILLARGDLDLDGPIASDTQPLWPAVDALLDAAGPAVHALRDATRGGVASVLNELARASDVSVLVREAHVPVTAPVAGACELLGIDPLYVANEGKMVVVVSPERADAALAALRAAPGGALATYIGEVRAEPRGMVIVETALGGRRVMDLLVGDPLPRIC